MAALDPTPSGVELRSPVDVHVVLYRRGRILLLRRAPDASYAAGLLCLPSGKVEHGEDVVTAARRELREETGVRVDPEGLRCVLVMQQVSPTGPARIGWFFVAEAGAGVGVGVEPETEHEAHTVGVAAYNAEPHKHTELLWIDPAAPPDDLVAYTRAGLDSIRAGRAHAVHIQRPDDPVRYEPALPSRLLAMPTVGATTHRTSHQASGRGTR